jgi:hypothetical protein
MKTLRLYVAAILSVSALLSAPQASAAPQCVEMRFLDEKGVLLPVNPPLIGILLGERPLFEGVPASNRWEPGRPTSCPPALIASVQKTFNESCLTEQSRAKAAAQNRADMSVVEKGCADMAKSLAK